MDYQKFLSQYEIIKLSGLKGQDYNYLAQDRITFKTYDYVEVIQRGGDIDKKINFLKYIHTLNHPNILTLHNYSYLFVQENHGDPFCKFFLVFEYCESSLQVELSKLKSQKKFLTKKQILKMTEQMTEAVNFLQEHEIKAKIKIQDIYYSVKGDFKLYVLDYHEFQQKKIEKNLIKLKEQIKSQIQKEKNLKNGLRSKDQEKPKNKTQKVMKIFYSPEEFYNMNSVLETKFEIDQKSSEMFNLGMIILQSAIQEDLSDLYKNYKFNQKLLESKIETLQQLYGEGLAKIIKNILIEQSQRYNAYNTLMIINKSEDAPENKFEFDKMLPQEYQAELDNKISKNIKIMEEQFTSIIMYANGDRFRGYKDENGLIQGWAQYWFSKGQKYEGEFLDNKYHGIGVFFWPTGVKHYGEFQNGEITGMGVRYQINNEIYFGQWKKNQNEGFGTYFWSNGARFMGEFHNDIIMGKGTLVLPETDGKSVKNYDGIWIDNGSMGLVTDQDLVIIFNETQT